MLIPEFKPPLLYVMSSFSVMLEKHQCSVTFDLREPYLGTSYDKIVKLIKMTYPNYSLTYVGMADNKYKFTLKNKED